MNGAKNGRSFLLDVAGAAGFLGLTEKQVRARVARRTLPTRREGSRVFFLREELEEYFRGLPGVSVEEARENAAGEEL